MSARPGEWHLLGHSSDPVPGDVSAAYDEARDYRLIAGTISDQIDRLRRLAETDSALKGHYADALTDSMRDLAGNLEKIQGRFDTVASEITRLAPELSEAVTGTKRALDDAVAAQAMIDANEPAGPRPPGAPELTDEQKDAAERRAGRHDAGVGALADARTACQRVLSAFDEVADDVARRIKDASDDDMKDSAWDRFKDMVNSIATELDFLADLLGWIATILTVVALFIPGVNLLVFAIIVMVGALLIHTLLAATGNGSWVDVAFDVLALVTLGMAQKGITLARLGRTATLTTAGRQSGRAAAQTALNRASFNGGRGVIGGTHRFLLRTFSSSTRAGMRSAYDDAFRAVTSRQIPSTTVRQRLASALDGDIASLRVDLNAIRREFGETVLDPRFAQGLSNATRAAWTGIGIDVTQKGLEGIKLGPFHVYEVPPYNDFKDRFTTTIGGPL